MAYNEVRGAVQTAHSGVATTTTSAEIDLGNEFLGCLVVVDITGSGQWTVKVQGTHAEGGNYGDLTDIYGNAMSITTSTDVGQGFFGCTRYIKIVATEDSGTATCTVKLIPLNQ